LRLVDRESGDPIDEADIVGNWGERRARVLLSPDTVSRPTKFPDGVVRIYELRPPSDPSSLTLIVTAPGYLQKTLTPMDVGSRSNIDLGDVPLERAPKLRFHVVDATTGKPIKRAMVSVRSPATVERPEQLWTAAAGAEGRNVKDRTNADGRVEVDAMLVPKATLVVDANDYPTYRDEEFSPRDTDREHRIALVKGGDLDVFVVDPRGAPVEKARVLMRRTGSTERGQGESTNGAGLARWRTLDAARYEVRAFRAGDDPAGGDGAGDVEWTEVDVLSSRTAEVVLEVDAAARVHGVVVAGGGRPRRRRSRAGATWCQ
jgi:hypothetical protein